MTTIFDPFSTTLEQAQAEPDAYAVRGAVARWAGAQELLQRQAFFEVNPLDGIAVCCIHDLVAPEWLALAYLRGFYKVTGCQVRTWDEAFGPAFPKGVNLAARRRARRDRVHAIVVVKDMLDRDPGRPMDKAFWSEVGVAIGEGATRAEELWREALALGFAHHPRRSQPASFRKAAGVRRRR